MFSTQGKLYMPVHKACKLLPLLFTPLLSPFLSNPFSAPEKHELQGVNVTPGRTTLAGTDPVGCWAAAALVEATQGRETHQRSLQLHAASGRAAGEVECSLGTAPDPGSLEIELDMLLGYSRHREKQLVSIILLYIWINCCVWGFFLAVLQILNGV